MKKEPHAFGLREMLGEAANAVLMLRLMAHSNGMSQGDLMISFGRGQLLRLLSSEIFHAVYTTRISRVGVGV